MNHLQHNPETGMVLDPHSGLRFKVNPSGALIMKSWQARGDIQELLRELEEMCGMTHSEAERSYLTFTRQCRAAGLRPPAVPALGTPSGIRSDPRNSSAA